jgi:hypothetical protein
MRRSGQNEARKTMNLSPEDAKLFFELMWGLQHYVNQQRGVLKDIPSPAEYAKLPTQKKIKVRDALWKSPDLIDAYIKENPESLSSEYLEIVRSWKGFVKGEFFILRHLKKYTIFIGNKDQVYGVLGLNDSLEEIVPSYALPSMVEAVLLPFKGRIAYDGLLQGYRISFGGGIRSDLNHTYIAAKQKERIITTLETGTGKAQPAAHKIIKSWLPQLEEIASAASKLKGETALQNAAFTLLRASLEMAKCAETNPDDLDALFAGERKVRKAATRLSTVLDIEAED